MDKLFIDLRSFPQVTKEFLRALCQSRTYSLLKNPYCIFGILWGIPIPIVTIGIHLYSSHLLLTLSNVIAIIQNEPFYYFFILHPIFFAIVFGAMGTVRYNKEQKIEESEKNLINKNAELERINKKLQELDKLKSNFLSMVSHELRTPLTTIQGYVSFLLTEKAGSINQAQKECLTISNETANLLNHLIGELLTLSKIERGEFGVNLEHIDIRETINKATASLQLFADNNGITLENNLPQDLPLVLADRERILQVITNLLENAVKFNRKNGKVYLTASQTGNGKVLFCVADTGIGIPKDRLNKVFDKFYQIDSFEKRKHGGCGLGLAITKNIIELHRGKIWIESEFGTGSKFFFELLSAPQTTIPPLR